MAAIVLLKHLPSGKNHSFYTVDAKELLGGPEKGNWEFVKRLDRGAKMIEHGVAAIIDPKTGGALEFIGDRTVRGEPAQVAADESSLQAPQTNAGAPGKQRGQRGGGVQEPAQASTE